MDFLLLLMALLLFVGFAIAEVWSLARWRSGWRVAAVLPLLGVLFVALRIVVDTRRDPTSHNLWPFEIVFGTAVALAALGLLYAAQRMSGARTRS